MPLFVVIFIARATASDAVRKFGSSGAGHSFLNEAQGDAPKRGVPARGVRSRWR